MKRAGRSPRGDPAPRSAAALAVEAARLPVPRARLLGDLRRLAGLAAARAGRSVRLSVAVLGDAPMRRLNRERLGHDYATDVLSFVLEDGPRGLLGDLALGAGVARREAASRGVPAYHELLLYAVHGTLHLLGHDDHAPRARAAMRRAEREVLAALGLGDVFGAQPRGRGVRARPARPRPARARPPRIRRSRR